MIALSASVVACDDPLSPDQQRRLVESILDPTRDDNFGDIHIAPVPYLRQVPHAEIVVEVDGEWARFAAFAVEFFYEPDTGHFGPVSRNKRMLIAWRVDDPSERFFLGGGASSGLMGPITLENEPEWMFALRPHVTMRGSDGRKWQARAGRRLHRSVALRQDCDWPAGVPFGFGPEPDVRCESGSYEVGFEAELGKRWSPTEGRLMIRMPEQQVPGVRLTYTCDFSDNAQSRGCGELRLRPGPCDPGYAGQPGDCPAPGEAVFPPTDSSRTGPARTPPASGPADTLRAPRKVPPRPVPPSRE